MIALKGNAQLDLKTSIENILKGKKAQVGVAIASNKSKDAININNDFQYPLQSVFKFPIALTILSEVDKGKFSIDQPIEISKNELAANTWSPIKDKFPDGTILTLGEILAYTVAQSDNIGCDILLKLIGGTATVETFLKDNIIEDIVIKVNEQQMHEDWAAQYKNWGKPTALNELLIKAYRNEGQMLSHKSHELIWKIMRETTTGTKRLKGNLPQHVAVAHKTGTSGTREGLTPATNDIGVIELPDGEVIFISVLVVNFQEQPETNEQLIAKISKAAFDYYKR
nr:class A beta-lactamase, subclass A2 [Flavimarina sp. Hel_I_48]